MGVKTIDSDGEGFAKFGKGDNAYLKPLQIDMGWNDYEDEPQLDFVFQAVSTEGGTPGRIPGYISSKITVREDDQFSSTLAKLLIAAEKLEAVLQELGLDEETVKNIVSPQGNQRYEADNEQENQELYAAVTTHLADVTDLVVKGGTKLAGKNNDYSKMNDIYERVEQNPFAEQPAEPDATKADAPAESPAE